MANNRRRRYSFNDEAFEEAPVRNILRRKKFEIHDKSLCAFYGDNNAADIGGLHERSAGRQRVQTAREHT